MRYTGIILTGTSASGKSTIAQALCSIDSQFEVVKAITTRRHRAGDFNYKYTSQEDFNSRKLRGEFVIDTTYRSDSYSIAEEDINQVIANNKVPILIISPKSTKSSITINGQFCNFLSFFIDSDDSILEQRLKERNGNVNVNKMITSNNEDREYQKYSFYNILTRKEEEITEIAKLVIWLWEKRNMGGIIPFQIIQLLIKYSSLVESEDIINLEESISAASFDLTLGSSYYQNGKIKDLNDKEPNIIIHPGDYIIAGSQERVNMPATISGRFDLTVSMFCKGLILSNGPQVDPGFKGPLFCLLFNTSNEKIELKKGTHYATIEFHKLIEHSLKPYSEKDKYQHKEKIMHYLPVTESVSIIHKLQEDISSLKNEKRFMQTLSIVISIIGILLAAAALIVTLK